MMNGRIRSFWIASYDEGYHRATSTFLEDLKVCMQVRDQ